MANQIIPTAECEEAAWALHSLLKGRTGLGPSDDYYRRDWAPLWAELSKGGWTTIADRSSQSEAEFSLLDLTAIAEAWGRHLVPQPFVATLLARRWLRERPDPTTRLSHVLPERGQPLIAHFRDTDMVATGAGLMGRDRYVETVAIDDWAESMPIAMVSGEAPCLDGEQCREAAVLSAAEAVGSADAALGAAIEYAKMREQFGQPIARFQAVKHKLANMHCTVELARSALAWACTEPAAASRALRFALDASLRVVEDSIQVHGGIGFTWEVPLHRYCRHVMACRRVTIAALGEA